MPAFAVVVVVLLLCLSGGAVRAQDHAVVLQYRLEDAPRQPAITRIALQRHLRHLRENRYQVLPLPEVIASLRSGKALPERAVAITFDDATREVCDDLFPLLQSLNLPFTVFVQTDAIDRGSARHCSWDQLRELAASGVTIANQTVSHRHLAARDGLAKPAWRERASTEIARAEQRIREEIGHSHHLLAWPFGEFSAALKKIAAEAGYVAFGLQPGPVGRDSDWLELPRFSLQGDANLEAFSARLQTLPFPLKAVHRPPNPLRVGADAPTLELILRPGLERLPRRKLQCFTDDGRRIGSNWLSESRFRVRAYRPLPAGRAQYSCMLPLPQGRMYWYSQLWISADADGQWPD